jgi:hypothetical protein
MFLDIERNIFIQNVKELSFLGEWFIHHIFTIKHIISIKLLYNLTRFSLGIALDHRREPHRRPANWLFCPPGAEGECGMPKDFETSGSKAVKIGPGAAASEDRVFAATRWLAIIIIPFLVVASVLLYVWPDRTDVTFAWTIKPSMTPMMLAAAYMGGIYFFVQVARARQWHTIKVGFLPVTAFAGLLGVATILHWDRFNHSHISFITWTALYFTTPFLVIAAWLRNRVQDSGPLDPSEVRLPARLRWVIGLTGILTLLVSLFLFLSPPLMISLWPWTLTPLTARVVGAMFALPGIVGLGIAFDPRWSAARIILQSQSFSILMILIAAVRAWGDFDPAKIATWLFLGGLLALLVLIAALTVYMQHAKPALVPPRIS